MDISPNYRMAWLFTPLERRQMAQSEVPATRLASSVINRKNRTVPGEQGSLLVTGWGDEVPPAIGQGADDFITVRALRMNGLDRPAGGP
jgi:hypothetical protein